MGPGIFIGTATKAGGRRSPNAYRWDFLNEFTHWPIGTLEKTEKLEQLRALEHGGRIHVIKVDRATHGIDTATQYSEFVARHKREFTAETQRTQS